MLMVIMLSVIMQSVIVLNIILSVILSFGAMLMHGRHKECQYVDWMQGTLIEWDVSVQLTLLLPTS
jgi:hypothetical protein